MDHRRNDPGTCLQRFYFYVIKNGLFILYPPGLTNQVPNNALDFPLGDSLVYIKSGTDHSDKGKDKVKPDVNQVMTYPISCADCKNVRF